MYKNLVLSGGSSKGYSYIGVLKTLEKYNIINNIKTFVGTSVGSIYSTLFSMGFKSNDFDYFLKMDINIKDVDIDYLLYDYGFYSGKEIINILQKVIEQKYNKNITFKELHKLKKNKLVICVTNLNKKKIEYLSYENYPNMKILEAIRCAITIPFIFTTKKYNNNYFIDAALIQNISFYNLNPKETLGIMLLDKKEELIKINNIENYIINIYECFKINHINSYNKDYKVIKIYCENISMFDFNLNYEKRKYLINCGSKYIENFLKKNN